MIRSASAGAVTAVLAFVLAGCAGSGGAATTITAVSTNATNPGSSDQQTPSNDPGTQTASSGSSDPGSSGTQTGSSDPGTQTGSGDSGSSDSGGDVATSSGFDFVPPDPATKGTNTATAPAIGDPLTGSTHPFRQTVLEVTSTSIKPDTATEDGGATIAIESWDPSGASEFRLTIPGLGIDETFASATVFKGPATVTGSLFALAMSNLNYVALGLWQASANAPTYTVHYGAFTTGYETPASSMPTSGSATYSGTDNVGGVAVIGNSGGTFAATLDGDASLSADFAAGTVTGGFTNMKATSVGTSQVTPWNDVAVTASIVSGTSEFSGTTAATSAPAGTYVASTGATGHIDGAFYGPQADELGAVWTLGDPSTSTAAIGVVGAARDVPAGTGTGGSGDTGSSGTGIDASSVGSSGVVIVISNGTISGTGVNNP